MIYSLLHVNTYMDLCVAYANMKKKHDNSTDVTSFVGVIPLPEYSTIN